MECNVAALAADKSWLGMWQKERITEAQGNPRAVRNMGKRLRKYLDQTEWCTTTKMKVGGFLISTFIESAKDEHGAPSLVHASPFVSYRKQVGMVKMTEEVYDSIAGNTLHFGEPTYLPMIVPPVPWKSNLTGGYFTLKSNILRFRSKSQLNVIRRARMQPVLDGLNFLAQIPWRVNLEVFETIKVLYARGETVEGIPSRVDAPLPSEAECYVPPDKVSRPFGKRKGEGDSAAEAMDKSTAASDDHLVFDQSYFNYVTKKVVQKNMATHSLRCDLEIKLRIAEEFKNDDMYFPWNMDFRGGQAVNLLPSEKPQDVYSEVLVLVLDAIEKDCEGEVDENNPADLKKQRCARTIRGKVDRKVIKQTVMTSVYGVTPVGARLQIGARLREKLYGDAEVTLDQEQDQVVYEAAQ
ncbi:RPOT2 [Symbiodinium microadriaticum]|nr:RPOT2 [Symbiodinium microadriaticum]